MGVWYLPVTVDGYGFGPHARTQIIPADIVGSPGNASTALSSRPVISSVTPGAAPLRVWSDIERCVGWRWPAIVAIVEPVGADVFFPSARVALTSSVRVSGVAAGSELWCGRYAAIQQLVRRAAQADDERCVSVARVWLDTRGPARRNADTALRKLIVASSRSGLSVAARSRAVEAFNARPRRIGRRIGEPARAALRAAIDCIVIEDQLGTSDTGLSRRGYDLLTRAWLTATDE